jgi:hypothetical protein
MATTVNQIAFTVGWGIVCFILCFLLFGYAITKRHVFIAPRATARPSNVIYNPQSTEKRKKTVTSKNNSSSNNNSSSRNNDPLNDDDTAVGDNIKSTLDDVQYRGNPIWGWISWTLSLNYDTLLRGVPGTGTRNNGLDGVLLNVTLDGIVLLRFHALALRVSIVATILYLFFLAPVYASAVCYWWYDPTSQVESCTLFKEDFIDNTITVKRAPPDTFSRMTILNVPMQHHLLSDDSAHRGISRWFAATTNIDHINDLKLYFVVVLFYIVIFYTFSQLHTEWISILALRRVYYLEYDVYGERKRQIRKISELDNSQDPDSIEPHLYNREPFIPHPELQETIPNVSLYSVLVGGLPTSPNDATRTLCDGNSSGSHHYNYKHQHQYQDNYDIEQTAATNANNNKNWQLELTTAFFDQCVPNQPGFSSSVAAVTIIPGAAKMTIAWKKWSKAAINFRRLRFLHELIQIKKREQEQQITLDNGNTANILIDEETDEIFVPEEIVDMVSNLPVGQTSTTNNESTHCPNTEAVMPIGRKSDFEDIEIGLRYCTDQSSTSPTLTPNQQSVIKTTATISTGNFLQEQVITTAADQHQF